MLLIHKIETAPRASSPGKQGSCQQRGGSLRPAAPHLPPSSREEGGLGETTGPCAGEFIIHPRGLGWRWDGGSSSCSPRCGREGQAPRGPLAAAIWAPRILLLRACCCVIGRGTWCPLGSLWMYGADYTDHKGEFLPNTSSACFQQRRRRGVI